MLRDKIINDLTQLRKCIDFSLNSCDEELDSCQVGLCLIDLIDILLIKEEEEEEEEE